MFFILAIVALLSQVSLAAVSVYGTWNTDGGSGFTITGLTDSISVDNKYFQGWKQGEFGVAPGTIFFINNPGDQSRTHIKFLRKVCWQYTSCHCPFLCTRIL